MEWQLMVRSGHQLLDLVVSMTNCYPIARVLSGLIAQSIHKQGGTGFVLVPYNTTINAVQDSNTGRVQATIRTQALALLRRSEQVERMAEGFWLTGPPECPGLVADAMPQKTRQRKLAVIRSPGRYWTSVRPRLHIDVTAVRSPPPRHRPRRS